MNAKKQTENEFEQLDDSDAPFWVLTIVCVLALAAFVLIARAGLLPPGW